MNAIAHFLGALPSSQSFIDAHYRTSLTAEKFEAVHGLKAANWWKMERTAPALQNTQWAVTDDSSLSVHLLS